VFEVQLEDRADPLGLRRVHHQLVPVDVDVVAEDRVAPAHLPLRRVAAILSRVRSEMISRSNWANDRSTLSTSRPITEDLGVLLSQFFHGHPLQRGNLASDVEVHDPLLRCMMRSFLLVSETVNPCGQ
jgi:hypothetical protein